MSKLLLKSVPTHLRWLIQPALFVSLLLHSLVLVTPIPKRLTVDQATQEQASKPDQSVKVVQSPPSSPLATPRASVVPTPKPVPVATPKLSRPAPLSARSKTQIPSTRSAAQPALRPSSPSAARPQGVPSPSAPPPPAPLVVAAVPSPDLVPPPNLPFGDVPLLAGAEAGCYGIGTCYGLSGVDFRAAGQTLETQFEAQGYTVEAREDLEETGRKIYAITKNGKTRYLNVMSNDLSNAVYVITPQPSSLEELQNIDLLKSELEATLDGLLASTPNATQFAQPNAFFVGATPRPETGGRLRLVAVPPPQLLSTLTVQLQTQGFALTEAGGYGGGLLYEVTQDAFTGYLNLVPSPDDTGTIVVLWSSLPE